MEPVVLQFCIRVTSDMINSPCGDIFADPIEPSDEEYPNYYSVIDEPRNLKGIKEKLEKNQYRSYEQWVADMNLVWNNSILYNQKESIYHDIAIFMKEKFQKMLRDKPITRKDDWFRAVCAQYQRLSVLLESPPSIVETEPKKRPAAKILQKIAELGSKLETKSDIYSIIQILHFYGVPINTKLARLQLDLKSLPTDPLIAIRDYVTAVYEHRDTQ